MKRSGFRRLTYAEALAKAQAAASRRRDKLAAQQRPQAPRKGLPRQSAATKAANAKYLARLPSWRAENPECRAGFPPWSNDPKCTGKTTDCHHSAGRGKRLLMEQYWVPVCAACHAWIESHGKEARRLGLILWQKNRPLQDWELKKPGTPENKPGQDHM